MPSASRTARTPAAGLRHGQREVWLSAALARYPGQDIWEGAVQVNVLEAKNTLSQLIVRATEGEEVIIARRDVPMVRLVPVDADLSFGTGAVVLEWLDRHPLPARSHRTPEQIDADIEAEREGWE